MIGYTRVSTEEQAESGHGLDAQHTAIENVHPEPLRWIEDAGKSAKNLDRPGLTYALELLRDGTEDGLIVSKLDRLSRSVPDFADILKRAGKEDWTLIVADLNLDFSTPFGRAIAQILMVFAELEREMIGQRTREGLAAAKAKGVRLGGYGAKPRVAVDVERRIRRERAEDRSYRAIANDLNRDGVATAQGGVQWHPATVRSIVQRQARPELANV